MATSASEPPPATLGQVHLTGQTDHAAGTLLRMPLPDELAKTVERSQDAGWELIHPVTKKRTPCQPRQTETGWEMVWLLDEPLTEGAELTYVLSAQSRSEQTPSKHPPSKSADWTAQDNGAEITLAHGERRLLVYNHETDQPPQGVSPLYARSGYVHPVYSPAGKVLSDDFPPDHHHQHGLFFAWVNTRVQGEQIDFWNQIKGTGTVRHAATTAVREGPVFAELQVKLEHITHPGQSAEQIALREDWTILTHQADRWNVWEVQSRQTNVLDSDIELSKHHYGGFGFRGARAWSLGPQAKRLAQFVTSSGKDREAGNHTAAEWVMLHGPIPTQADQPATADDPHAGIVIISHPDNLRAPQLVRLHPEKPYFCFCPIVKERYVLQPGEHLDSRYLLVTFDDEITPEQIDHLSKSYFHPPTIQWK